MAEPHGRLARFCRGFRLLLYAGNKHTRNKTDPIKISLIPIMHTDHQVLFGDIWGAAYEISMLTGSPWNWSAEETDRVLDIRAPRVFLRLIYRRIDVLLDSESRMSHSKLISSYFDSRPAPSDESPAAQAVLHTLHTFLCMIMEQAH